MPALQTIADLKHAQKATHKITDKKKAKAEWDRFAGLIAEAEHQADYEASQAEVRAEEARRQQDIEFRKENLETFNAVDATIAAMRKENDEIRDDVRRLEARIAKMNNAIPNIGRILGDIDNEDYSRFGIDWNGALASFIAYHRSGRVTHQQEYMVAVPMDEAINRAAGRVAYAKKYAKLPQ